MPENPQTEIVEDRSSHGSGPMVRKDQAQDRKAGTKDAKFGRIFPREESAASEELLEKLGLTMNEGRATRGRRGDNPLIPAGFTYLGQFIDHDITFDPTSLKEREIDPDALVNFRSPALDLDSIYGGGRATQPYLYLRRTQNSDMFVIGATTPFPETSPEVALKRSYPNDLPRASNGLAILPEPRNDENLIVAQLHLAFMKFHNKVVAGLKSKSIDGSRVEGDNDFEKARRIVVWHYQWIVLHDFLEKILNKGVLKEVRKLTSTFMTPATYAFMPVEFSMAAYRLGHSMVRQAYPYNRFFSGQGTRKAATLNQLFQFTGRSHDPKNPDFGVTPIPSNWVIDWRRFFDLDRVVRPTATRLINTHLAPELFRLHNVGNPNSTDIADKSSALPVRNLIRGHRTDLPSGQTVARAIGVAELGPGELMNGTQSDEVIRGTSLETQTPLWFYVLKEAEVREHGERLGEVGSWIVAQTFMALMLKDERSYLVKDPSWRPTLNPATPGKFTMADLLAFVDEVNPLGDDPVPTPVAAAPGGTDGTTPPTPTNGSGTPVGGGTAARW